MVKQKTLQPAYLLVFSLNFLSKLPISQMFAANGRQEFLLMVDSALSIFG